MCLFGRGGGGVVVIVSFVFSMFRFIEKEKTMGVGVSQAHGGLPGPEAASPAGTGKGVWGAYPLSRQPCLLEPLQLRAGGPAGPGREGATSRDRQGDRRPPGLLRPASPGTAGGHSAPRCTERETEALRVGLVPGPLGTGGVHPPEQWAASGSPSQAVP